MVLYMIILQLLLQRLWDVTPDGLTAAAALAKSDDCEGVDLIYLPEKVFDIDHFMARVKEIAAKGRSMVIAVSEGIKVADGRYVFELSEHVEFVDALATSSLLVQLNSLLTRLVLNLASRLVLSSFQHFSVVQLI